MVNPPHPSDHPAEADPASGVSYPPHDTSAYAYAQYDAYGYGQSLDEVGTAVPYEADPYAGTGYDVTGTWYVESGEYGAAIPAQQGPPQGDGFETVYGTAQWSEWDQHSYDAQASTSWGTGLYESGGYDAAAYQATADYAPAADEAAAEVPATTVPAESHDPAPEPDPGPEPGAEPEIRPEPLPQHLASRGRRRSPRPHRSALLTVAAPSVAVLGVAGVAAASVGGAGAADETTVQASAPDPATVKSVPSNTKLDTQLAGLSDGAGDFADRASRTQERIDLKKRQEAERKRKAAEAARREAMRPKFVLPVAKGSGISAYFGQAGVNWMSVHTGIDFPVSYGTPVHAATDGTITTKWNSAYGNMAIITASDGTETWYCHLSSTRVRSGPVKAGDLIAYSGSSGNSTGPHLHFEVHPHGGSAAPPLPWFRSHGLEPG